VICWERSPCILLVHGGRGDGHLVREGEKIRNVYFTAQVLSGLLCPYGKPLVHGGRGDGHLVREEYMPQLFMSLPLPQAHD
jgi:hypothetical protein